MARIRSIKPEFFSSLTIGRLPMGARLLFIALWCDADDAGRLVDSPKRICGIAFPHDEGVSVELVDQWLGLLSAEGLIVRYEADRKRCISIRGWREHQRVSHATESRLPEPPSGDSGVSPEILRSDSGAAPEPLATDLGSRIIGSRNRDLGSRKADAPAREPDPSKPIWAQRLEPLNMHGPIPDTLEAIMAFEWRGEPVLRHLKKAAPELSEVQLWDQAENALNYRGTATDLKFRQWYWPDGCLSRMVAWLTKANSEHCNAEAARARLAKTGAYVADTKGRR